MIWVAATNYFTHQFTKVAGYFLEWSEPLNLQKIDQLNSNINMKNTQAIVVFGSDRQKSAIELQNYQEP